MHSDLRTLALHILGHVHVDTDGGCGLVSDTDQSIHQASSSICGVVQHSQFWYCNHISYKIQQYRIGISVHL